jgi:hypothetical protein
MAGVDCRDKETVVWGAGEVFAEEESRSRAEARWIAGAEGVSIPPAEAGGKEVPAEAGRKIPRE